MSYNEQQKAEILRYAETYGAAKAVEEFLSGASPQPIFPLGSLERFNYDLLKRVSHVARRVEKHKYIGGSRWLRSYSIQFDFSQLKQIMSERGINTKALSVFHFPLLIVDKARQFADFDARDHNGLSIPLAPRKNCTQFALNALRGAILEETPDSEPLNEDDLLAGVLRHIFDMPTPPIGSDGKYLEEIDQDCMNKIYRAALDLIERYADSCEKPEEVYELCVTQFNDYFVNSPTFRWFLRTFTFYWLPYLEVALSKDESRIIKVNSTYYKDITGQNSHEKRFRQRGLPFAKGIRFEIELDYIGTAESEHITVEAPDGTFFAPCYPVKGSRERKDVEESLYFITDDHHPDDQDGYDVDASGILTTERALLKTKKYWTDGGEHRFRRIPNSYTSEHRYSMTLKIVPKLGLRAVGYCALFGLSALAFFMCSLDYTTYLADGSSFSFSSLLVLAPIVVMIAANREEEPFIRRAGFRFLRHLSYGCIALDILGFIYLFFASLTTIVRQPAPVPDWTRPLTSIVFDHQSGVEVILQELLKWTPILCGFLTFICLIFFILGAIWSGKHHVNKKRWTKLPGAFDLFKVLIRPYNEGREYLVTNDTLETPVSAGVTSKYSFTKLSND
jgi:hypothetical protein